MPRTLPDPVPFLADLARKHQAAGDPPRIGAGSTNEPYRGARIDRHTERWLPHRYSGDAAVALSYDRLTARLRDLAINDPIIANALRKICTMLIGTGINAFADPLDITPGDDSDEDVLDGYADLSDELFEHWSTNEADAEERLGWPDMQKMALREVLESGEVIMLRCYDNRPGRTIPLCYQIIESDQVDKSRHGTTAANGNRIANGVELDRRNRAVAYYIFDAHPYDNTGTWSSQSTRIPADRVLHLYFPHRPSQHGGISWFNAMVQLARDADLLVGNELTSSSLAALFTAIDYGESPMSGIDDGTTDDAWYDESLKLGKGNILHRRPTDKFDIIESTRPNKDVAPFIQLLLQIMAMSAGISIYRLTGRYSDTTYSSGRAAQLDDYAFVTEHQGFLGRALVLPVRRSVNQYCVAAGYFNQFFSTSRFRDYQRQLDHFGVYGTGLAQLDPEKETDASAARCRIGTSNLLIEAAKTSGLPFRKIMRGTRRANRLAAKYGVSIDLSKQQGGNQRDRIATTTDQEDPDAA